jgi:GNAT superfamily N-acetyltransferase
MIRPVNSETASNNGWIMDPNGAAAARMIDRERDMTQKSRKDEPDLCFRFEKPSEMSEESLLKVESLIRRHGAVGPSYIRENLRNAYLIGYVTGPEGDVLATVVLKRQKEAYRKKLEEAARLDLSAFLERGYTSVEPRFRGCGIAGRLITGLSERAPGQRVYVTIDLANLPALELTRKNGMILAARFLSPRTGRELGLFVRNPDS